MSAALKVKARRDYGKDAAGKKRPGVTTVIGAECGWNKNPLMFFSSGAAAKAAVEGMLAGGTPEAVIERARKAHLKIRDDAGDAGTLAHVFSIDIFLRTGVSPPEPEGFHEDDERTAKARKAFEKFRAWWPTSGYEAVEVETALVDEVAGYGGTFDILLRRKSDGALIVADLKTSKGVYDETILQLGAYSLLLAAHGRHVQGGLVIHCPVEGDDPCRPIELSPQTLQLGAAAFTALLYVHKNRSSLKLNLDGAGGVP